PAPSVVCVEDTHLGSGGRPWPLDRLEAVAGVGVPVHLDGARLFNAAVATGTTVAARAAGATTVTSCLSKGLAAPVGSLLAGPADLIDRARLERKRLGGGMRPGGILAAAGPVPPGWWRWTPWSTGWPTTTAGPGAWPRPWPPAGPPPAATRPRSTPTWCCSPTTTRPSCWRPWLSG